MIPPSEGEDIVEPKPIVVVRFDAFDPVRKASSRLLRQTAYRTFCVRTCDGFYWPVNVAYRRKQGSPTTTMSASRAVVAKYGSFTPQSPATILTAWSISMADPMPAWSTRFVIAAS